MLQVDTDTQNTLLGHKTERAEQQEQHRIDVYQAFIARKREVENAMKERNDDIKPPVEPEPEVEVESEAVNEVVNEVVNDTPMTPQQRAAEVYKARKMVPSAIEE